MSGNIQRKRWGFTYNDYPRDKDYKSHFASDEFNIERAVWGYEKSSSGTPHLQGYLELSRSFRLGFLKRILQSAHWYAVNGNSKVNFDYCTKSGNFDFYGDFSKEMAGENSMKPLAPALIVKALLNPRSCIQIKLSKEYCDRSNYFDKTASLIKNLSQRNNVFNSWKSKKLMQ